MTTGKEDPKVLKEWFYQWFPKDNFFVFFNLQKLQQSWIKELDSRRLPTSSLGKTTDIMFFISPEDFQKDKDEYTKNAIALLNNSLDFYIYSKSASIINKPILEHYSAIMIPSFIMQSMVKFENPKIGHGIKIESGNLSIGAKRKNGNINFKIMKYGFFPRLVDFLTFLGYPSIYSSFIIDKADNKYVIYPRSSKFSLDNDVPIVLNQFGDFVDEYQKNLKMWTEDSLKEIEPTIKFKPIWKREGSTMKFPYDWVSRMLTSFLILNMSSILARYYPRIWDEIIDGKDTAFINIYNGASSNLNNFISGFSKILNDLKYLKYEQY